MVQLNFIVTIIVVALAYVFAEELYSDRHDNVDIRAILANEKVRKQYYNCFMDIAPCRTADAKFFKGIIKEVIRTQCRKCTEKQKNILDYMVVWYIENKLDEWNAFIKKIIEDA